MQPSSATNTFAMKAYHIELAIACDRIGIAFHPARTFQSRRSGTLGKHSIRVTWPVLAYRSAVLLCLFRYACHRASHALDLSAQRGAMAIASEANE